MLQKLKLSLMSLLVFGLFAVPILATGDVSAQSATQAPLECGADFKLTASGCTPTGDANDEFQALLTNIVNIISVIVGVVAVIMIIFGGFRYITSGGDSNKVGTAKNTILYALIGLVIVALAQFIVRFVLKQTADVTT